MQFEDIKTVAVVGAGQMGRGIAQVCATTGYQVRLMDVKEHLVTEGITKIRASLDRGVERGNFTQRQSDDALAVIRPITQVHQLKDVQLVIEAIPEDAELKQRLFRELHQACRPDAILASNTSSISISRLAAVSGRTAQVVGIHFMNPVPVMRLVEIVQGRETAEHTLHMAIEFARKLGKVPVVSKDVPGFIVNRVLMPMINEAIFALEEGVASAEDIDLAMVTGANHPAGPLALADRIGLDTVLAICEVLYQDLGDPKFRPCPLLRRYVDAGWLGRKVGRGFFVYEASGARQEAASNQM
jgi:3-hydroxybutyryl-CoA dehydrogenase